MPTNISGTTTTNLKNSDSKTDHLKIHISNKDLLKGIQSVQSAISARSTLPVLSNILFQATEKGLRLSATDLEVGIRTWVKADVLQTGAITIPAKIISDFLKTIEDDKEIKIEVQENNKVEIRSGRDRLNVTGLPKSDYPVLPEFDESKAVSVPRAVLRELVKKTVFAASNDETRYVLNGIHLIVENGTATAVATDGRRLAFTQRPLAAQKLQIKVIIPTKALQELIRLLGDDKSNDGDINVFFTDNQASFSSGDTLILSRLIEGHFPNFEQVIPKTHDIQLSVKRTELLSSVTRAAVGTLERGGSIKLILNKGTLQIQAAAQGRVEVESELAVSYEGPRFEIAFNPLYVIDVLKALEHDDIFIELTTSLNPGVIRPAKDENYRYIMMPMKV
jgi:DNA polymerase-3 subunit beta